ncbi:MAG TPA: aminopeptidase [Gemmatimonadaceae bacterium]|nr:aminopeptidase [Gemmatimonadaceae bacterium]
MFPFQRITWRAVRRVLVALVLMVVAYLALAPTGRYLVRAAWAEGRILARRRSIPEIIRDPLTRPEVARRLRLVLAARSFAAESIGLKAKDSFTTYSPLDRDTLVLVLSGAYPDRLLSYTWWFPIVGRVPYKGYFDFSAARAATRQLASRGFDVYLRPSPAFSTLGWFNDPLLSTTLRADTVDLANTVIHELTHNTFYASGQAVFNESFANFVGARGSAWLFRTRGSPAAADQADARWADDKIMARFWAQLYRSVDSAFAAHPTDSLARIAARDTLYARARRALVDSLGPQLKTIPPQALGRIRLDNAALLAHRLYNTDLDLFDAVWVKENGNLRATVQRIIELAKRDRKHPFEPLRAWVASARAGF